MSKVLYIKANIKPEGQSRTFQISDGFVESYKMTHPQDQINVLDLSAENIQFLKQEDLNIIFGPKSEESRNHPLLKYAYQFVEADKYIIAAPFWNLSIPAVLKAYIDYITVTGITFGYTENGPVGLCHGKAIHIVTRGGIYSEGPLAAYEMGDKYLRTILGFLGITDFTSIVAEGMDIEGVDSNSILEDVIRKAKELAKNF